jgi:hypothetical protein
MNQHISYFLPPFPTSGRAKLSCAIEYLLSEDGIGEEELKLLAAIAESIIWSEECHRAFIKTGFDAALELYDQSTMNASVEQTEKDKVRN